MSPTNNDPYYRTVNRNVPAMSAQDTTQHNPWRAPGNAPVFDACGVAGGGPKWEPTQLSFVDTVNAKQGDAGSKVLPPRPTGVTWKMGSVVEAKWSVRANHGGGYSYRLCPLNSPLTEACFQSHPLDFAGQMALEWMNGTRKVIEGRYLINGTQPRGSEWAMMPLPFKPCFHGVAAHDPLLSGCSFEPPCAEIFYNQSDPFGPDNGGSTSFGNFTGYCSGRFPTMVSIVDWLKVPMGLTPGPYVLGLRYDCEMTSQVWSSCADIEIAA